jgi:hypothetical protein
VFTNTSILEWWKQHIRGNIEELTTATIAKVYQSPWLVMPYVVMQASSRPTPLLNVTD